jgi:hypothetical protein
VLGREPAQEWGRQCKELVIFMNWLLPYPCATTFFDRTKVQGGGESRHLWFSSFQESVDLEQLYQELHFDDDDDDDDDQGEDFDSLLGLARTFRH